MIKAAVLSVLMFKTLKRKESDSTHASMCMIKSLTLPESLVFLNEYTQSAKT